MTLRERLEPIQPETPYAQGVAVYPEEPKGRISYVIVGAAPSKRDEVEGRFFTGGSGKLLRDLVQEVGMQDVHYTNASYYRPPVRQGKDSKPSESVLKRERSRLMMEIRLLEPKVVVCLGATAAFAVCGQVPRSRGMVRHEGYLGHQFIVYITRHPTALLSDPDYYVDLVTDLKRAVEIKIPESVGLIPVRPICPVRFVGNAIYIDTEATGLNFATADLLCVAVTDDIDTYLFDTFKILADSVDEYHGQIIGHNVPGDELLLRRYGVNITFTGDTLLKHYATDERRGSHGLKVLSPTVSNVQTGIDTIWPYLHIIGGDDADDDEQSSRWSNIPRPVLEAYCVTDADCTKRLDRALLLDSRQLRVYSFLQHGLRSFSEGMQRGIRVDLDKLRTETTHQTEEVARLRGGFKFDPNKRTDLEAALKNEGYTVKGTSKNVLQGLKGPLPEAILGYRKEAKILEGFLRPLEGLLSFGVVHPVYKLFGTESGRTSCSDPNIQQVPPRLRHLFIARPEHMFVGWDMKQHEVRGIAYLSGDKALQNLLRDPQVDPHAIVGEKAGVNRATGKRSLFAVAYGASKNKLVSLGIPEPDAIRGMQAVREMMPGLEVWRKEVIKQMWEQGYVETPYGRRRHFYYIHPKTRSHQERVAVNFLPQSFCGDICLAGAINVYEQLGYPPLIFVHDSNVIEVPESDVDRVVKSCVDIVSNVFPNPFVSFIPEIKVGRTWGNMTTQEEDETVD